MTEDRQLRLIEALIVVVIVGVLAAIAIPKFFPSKEQQAWSAACEKAGGTPYRPYRSSRICLPPNAAIPITVQP